MADPHLLYMVMGAVVTGLVLWVIATNLWAPKQPALPSPEPPDPASNETANPSA